MTLSELTKIEGICVDWIRRNVEVFSKEVDLKTAQKIPGLRAVFGEAYPDPVRVVTLEHSVNDMEMDITNPKWRSTSVEFCGGTCVAITINPVWQATEICSPGTLRKQASSRTLWSPKSRALRKASVDLPQ